LAGVNDDSEASQDHRIGVLMCRVATPFAWPKHWQRTTARWRIPGELGHLLVLIALAKEKPITAAQHQFEDTGKQSRREAPIVVIAIHHRAGEAAFAGQRILPVQDVKKTARSRRPPLREQLVTKAEIQREFLEIFNRPARNRRSRDRAAVPSQASECLV